MPGLPGPVTTGGYRLAALAARATPGPVATALSVPFGAGAVQWNPERRAMVQRHLRRVDPTLDGPRLRRAVQRSFDSSARYWIESLRLPSMSSRAVARGFREHGYPQIVDALGAGNGAILALPHLGGWEWAGRWIADQGHEITVVVERLEPPELFDWFVELRSALGMHVVALGPEAGGAVLSALRDNHIVCLLSDRDIQRSGPPVDFFGETTTLPGGAATLSLRTGAPIFPTAVYFTDRISGHLGLVRPALDSSRGEGRLRDDVGRITQDLARELEGLIRRAPTQWHLFQPNWPTDPGYSTRGPRMPTK
ncbi:phosphatidylinositol mannoside acyltransferase [Ilumatobacter sp.]|uniref:phosphatidylinositol mannoside acyltransferase n=1 Tax=Ilumatobacter sp. TaxID=1967498 RepID=UPI003B52C38D